MAKICRHRIASRQAPPPSSRDRIMTTPPTTGLKKTGSNNNTHQSIVYQQFWPLQPRRNDKRLINTVAKPYWTACKLQLRITQLEEWMKLLPVVSSKSDMKWQTGAMWHKTQQTKNKKLFGGNKYLPHPVPPAHALCQRVYFVWLWLLLILNNNTSNFDLCLCLCLHSVHQLWL